jgi:acyl-[acyl-carrier-protein]-phospholipid O-acyltransferase/long-chain-fatty-acid--[acyl-carrier-protein] ligase
MRPIKTLLRWLLTLVFRVRVRGLEHLVGAQGPRVVVANHVSFIDGLLLGAFLPGVYTYAVDRRRAQRWWVRPLGRWVRLFPMDPSDPLSLKGFIRRLRAGQDAVIFPEGRVTVTGGLMKIYDGAAVAADKAGAFVVPVRIQGAELSLFSRVGGLFPRRLFPRIRLTVLPPVRLSPAPGLKGRARRAWLGARLERLMQEMMFETEDRDRTLFQALLDARSIYGGRRLVAEDGARAPLSYDALVRRSLAIARLVEGISRPGERVGVLLPSSNGALATFLGVSAAGRVPALLNFTAGAAAMTAACKTAGVRCVITSRRALDKAGLQEHVTALAERVELVFLEDRAAESGLGARLWAALVGPVAALWYARRSRDISAEDPAVVLFTSGSEGTPKGVVLSHANLLANRAQISALFDLSPHDRVLNALPMFHAFGLTAGTLLPLLSGMRVFLYPSPLHYRIIPELAYEIRATVLFGTNTFLAGYAHHAHPYDFHSLRYVLAGAERLQPETRRLWMERFGLRILEGYGATETGPVLAANSPMAQREGTVGRLLPGIECRLEAQPGLPGGRLQVRGPNVMRGYLLPERPGILVSPSEGWYDTGDLVELDPDGFLRILGRVKRFAKIGGEMVSLAAVEDLAARVWPAHQHAAVSLSHPRKGERLVLVTTAPGAKRSDLFAGARAEGVSALTVPRELVGVESLPMLATGKPDYGCITELARQREAA